MAEYQDRFEALLPRVGTLTEVQLVQVFTAGLQPPLSLDVEVHNLQSLIIVMSLARKLELREQYSSTIMPTPSAPRQATHGLLMGPPQQLALPAPPPHAAAPPLTVEGRQVKRLSQSEMEERRRLGLCFNCNKKFGSGHNRVCQRIFLLDLAKADDAEDPEPTDAAVTVHKSHSSPWLASVPARPCRSAYSWEGHPCSLC